MSADIRFDIVLESTYQELSKMYYFQFPSTEWKVIARLVFFIVTTFQIWACHVTCVYELAKNFISRDTLLNFRKVTKYELDTYTGSRVIKTFRWGAFLAPPPLPGWNRVKLY